MSVEAGDRFGWENGADVESHRRGVGDEKLNFEDNLAFDDGAWSSWSSDSWMPQLNRGRRPCGSPTATASSSGTAPTTTTCSQTESAVAVADDYFTRAAESGNHTCTGSSYSWLVPSPLAIHCNDEMLNAVYRMPSLNEAITLQDNEQSLDGDKVSNAIAHPPCEHQYQYHRQNFADFTTSSSSAVTAASSGDSSPFENHSPAAKACCAATAPPTGCAARLPRSLDIPISAPWAKHVKFGLLCASLSTVALLGVIVALCVLLHHRGSEDSAAKFPPDDGGGNLVLPPPLHPFDALPFFNIPPPLNIPPPPPPPFDGSSPYLTYRPGIMVDNDAVVKWPTVLYYPSSCARARLAEWHLTETAHIAIRPRNSFPLLHVHVVDIFGSTAFHMVIDLNNDSVFAFCRTWNGSEWNGKTKRKSLGALGQHFRIQSTTGITFTSATRSENGASDLGHCLEPRAIPKRTTKRKLMKYHPDSIDEQKDETFDIEINVPDTHTADTNTADTNTADTNTADTNTADTNTADTNTADTNRVDDNYSGSTTTTDDNDIVESTIHLSGEVSQTTRSIIGLDEAAGAAPKPLRSISAAAAAAPTRTAARTAAAATEATGTLRSTGHYHSSSSDEDSVPRGIITNYRITVNSEHMFTLPWNLLSPLSTVFVLGGNIERSIQGKEMQNCQPLVENGDVVDFGVGGLPWMWAVGISGIIQVGSNDTTKIIFSESLSQQRPTASVSVEWEARPLQIHLESHFENGDHEVASFDLPFGSDISPLPFDILLFREWQGRLRVVASGAGESFTTHWAVNQTATLQYMTATPAERLNLYLVGGR